MLTELDDCRVEILPHRPELLVLAQSIFSNDKLVEEIRILPGVSQPVNKGLQVGPNVFSRRGEHKTSQLSQEPKLERIIAMPAPVVTLDDLGNHRTYFTNECFVELFCGLERQEEKGGY